MNSKRFRITIVYLLILFTLVFSFQGIAQESALAIPKNPICSPLRVECFPLPGSPKREQLIREKMLVNKFQVQDNQVYKLRDSKKSFSARKQDGAGLDCLPSNTEEFAKQLKETLDDK